MGAPSKKAKIVRSASEFDLRRLAYELQPPKANSAIFAWCLAEIFNARDQQMLGSFKLPARLAESMRTDDALAVAYENRLAPQRCIKVELVPAKGARGAGVAGEAEALFGQDGVGVSADTLSDIHGCLVNHGVAFAYCTATPRDDGSRVDVSVKTWPIEWVRWYPVERTFRTQTQEGFEENITHGDGRWVVFQKHELEPWKQEAAILPGSLVWARHAFAIRDWAKGSVAHGSAKVVGEMPEGVALQSSEGDLTNEASAFLDLLRSIASADAPVGIRPAGSKTEFLTNTSTAWQVWNELVMNAEKAAARIYLGTDGMLGSQGGAPGVDIQSLFGVATTRVQGDFAAIERGLLTGVIEPWAAINFGDSTLAPRRRYLVPDADADAERESTAKRNQAFFARVAALRANGFQVTQPDVDTIAKECGVTAPLLLPVAPVAPPAPLPSPQNVA